MVRRGVCGFLLTLLAVAAMAGSAAALPRGDAPGATASPPPQCFVMKSGELPLCEQRPDGTWDIIYSPGATSSGQSATKRAVEIAIVLLAVVGIGAIAWRQWLSPNRAGAAPPTPPFIPRTAPADWSNTYLPPAQPAAPSPVAVVPQAPVPPPTPPVQSTGAAQQILELNVMFNSGQITREEYDARRAAILGAP